MKSQKEKVAPPFFSIVLPVYNVEKYLNRCIESIEHQSFNDYEIILVDDGSKDQSYEICENWGKSDSRIKVIHKENAGLGYARNTGLEAATGKYIFFIDSDDYILPHTLDNVYKRIKEEKADAVFFGFSRVDKNGKCVFQLKPNPEKTYYSNFEEIKNVLLAEFIARDPRTGISRSLRISAWNCCISLDFLRENNIKFVSEREYISEDIYFYIELFAKLQSVSIICDVFYCYCQNEGSVTFSYKPDRFLKLKTFYQKITSMANELGYTGEVQLRLQESFIASTMACLKMEAANTRKIGIRKSYYLVKKIGNDPYFCQTVEKYPLEKYEATWKFFAYCIRKQHFILLYIILLLGYVVKGI